MGKSIRLGARALSATGTFWQSRCSVWGAAFLMLCTALMATPAHAVSGGVIGTLPRGDWVCETSGDAMGTPGVPAPDRDFTVIRASAYETPAGDGTYLLTGADLMMTTGPRRGEHYRLVSENFLRAVKPDGTDTDLRCVRSAGNNR